MDQNSSAKVANDVPHASQQRKQHLLQHLGAQAAAAGMSSKAAKLALQQRLQPSRVGAHYGSGSPTPPQSQQHHQTHPVDSRRAYANSESVSPLRRRQLHATELRRHSGSCDTSPVTEASATAAATASKQRPSTSLPVHNNLSAGNHQHQR